MNQCRTKNKLFRRKHEIRPMLPSQPIDVNVDPWWTVDIGCLYEDDIKVGILYFNYHKLKCIKKKLIFSSIVLIVYQTFFFI